MKQVAGQHLDWLDPNTITDKPFLLSTTEYGAIWRKNKVINNLFKK